MKVLFIYTEREGPLRGRQINLAQDYVCRIHEDSVIIEEKEGLPPKFFNVKIGKQGYSCWVSAVVGENGAGKTSFAELLAEVAHNPAGVDRTLVVVRKHGKFLCFKRGLSAIGNLKIVKLDGKVSTQSIRHAQDFFSFVYLTPCYTIASRFPKAGAKSRFRDLSTYGMLRKVCDREFAKELSECWRNTPMEVFASEEMMRMLQVVHRCKVGSDRKFEDGFDLRLPKAISIKLDERGVSALTDDLFGEVRIKSAFIKCFFSYVAAIRRSMMRKSGKEGRLPKAFLNYAGDLNGLCLKLKGSDETSFEMGIRKFFAFESREGSVYARRARRFFQRMKGFLDHNPSLFSKGIEITDLSEEDIEELLSIMTLYAQVRAGEDFLTVGFSPAMSSGEMASLSMWGRLFQCLDLQPFRGKNVVLFIDEAETTMHPQWQKAFVRNLLYFLETRGGLRRYHVILASHSPVLLSDIPGGNVCYLRRSECGDGRHPETFASNVYDLYRDQFFLHDGPVGLFAQDKIDELLQRIHGGLGCSNGDVQLVNLIGDRFVRHHLRSKLGYAPD